MTDSTQRTTRPIPTRATVVAAVQRTADGINVVVAERSNGSARLAAAETVGDDGLASLIKRHKPQRVVGVVPASHAICRFVTSPQLEQMDADELAGALALIGEAEVGDAAPAHRVAAGNASNAGTLIIQAWQHDDQDALDFPHVEPDGWITEPAALALLATRTRTDACKLAICAEPRNGMLTIVAERAGPANGHPPHVVRVVRLPKQGFGDQVAHALQEVAPNASLPEIGSRRTVHFDPDRVGNVGAVTRTKAWLSDYAIPWAAAEAALHEAPAHRANTMLQRDPEPPPVGVVERVTHFVTVPRNAIATVAVCLAILVAAPLVGAFAKRAVLESRAGGADALTERIDTARKQEEFYRLLREQRIPASKLLAELTNAAPLGVQFDVIDLSREGVTVRGTAEAQSQITALGDTLAAMRVFGNVEVPSRSATEAGVEFQLNAQVVKPLYSPRFGDPNDEDAEGLLDYSKRTLAQHVHGDEAEGWSASDTRAAPTSTRSTTSRSTSSTGRTSRESASRRTRETNDDDDDDASEPTRRTASSRRDALKEPPLDPLTEEQINAMDRTTVVKEFGKRRSAASKAQDPDEKAQREQEVKWLMEKLRSSRGGG